MATYKQICEDIKRRHGITVQNCWIAHVKELNGLNPRPAPNRHPLLKRIKPCPDDVRALIEASMKRFKMI